MSVNTPLSVPMDDDMHESSNDSWSPKIKNRRRFSATEAALLEEHYAEEPSPSQRALQSLADQMSTPRKTITTWFQNRRAKYKRRSYRKKSPKETDITTKPGEVSTVKPTSEPVSDIDTTSRSSSGSSIILSECISAESISGEEGNHLFQNLFPDESLYNPSTLIEHQQQQPFMYSCMNAVQNDQLWSSDDRFSSFCMPYSVPVNENDQKIVDPLSLDQSISAYTWPFSASHSHGSPILSHFPMGTYYLDIEQCNEQDSDPDFGNTNRNNTFVDTMPFDWKEQDILSCPMKNEEPYHFASSTQKY
ncbi:hypothetical protein BDF14DRAFT_881311 [Spinellus fusiger]|nr:hypothetical protein BDF14DRAFT_881311 [Spinellus fusiger]